MTTASGSSHRLTPRRYVSLLTGYLAPLRRRLLLLTVMVIGSAGLQLAGPQLLRMLIDAAGAGTDQSVLVRIALLFLGASVAQQGIVVAAAYVGASIGWTATNQLRSDVLRHCLQLDLGFHHTRTPGEMIERVDTDVSALANFFSLFTVRLVSSVLLLLGILILLFREDWRLGLAFTTFTFVAVGVLRRVLAVSAGRWQEARQRGAALWGGVGELLEGREDLRTCGAVEYALRRFFVLSGALMRADRAAFMASSLLWIAPIGVFAVGQGIALALGGALLNAGALTLGTVFMVFTYAELLRRPIDQLNTQLQDLQRAAGCIARVDGLLETASAVPDGPGVTLPSGPLAVALDHVSFAYPSPNGQQQEQRPPVLRDISFRLEPGEVLGILGRTGSGKSTIARLLFRFYDATDGVIRLGGVDVRAAALADLRGRIGLVTQEVQLFHASLRDNLTLFDRSIPDAKIVAVLEELGLRLWLHALADGLDTWLAPQTASVSGGEAQLLAFARVFLDSPDLVVLDEPSSRLDPATERAIEGATGRLLAGRTAIIIAHRLSTIRRADRLLLLDDGCVREQGSYHALAADPCSQFSRLLRSGVRDLDSLPGVAPVAPAVATAVQGQGV